MLKVILIAAYLFMLAMAGVAIHTCVYDAHAEDGNETKITFGFEYQLPEKGIEYMELFMTGKYCCEIIVNDVCCCEPPFKPTEDQDGKCVCEQ